MSGCVAKMSLSHTATCSTTHEAQLLTDEVLLRFQPPHLDINTLEMDGHVYCASPSQDGTMLAIGCQRSSGGMGKTKNSWDSNGAIVCCNFFGSSLLASEAPNEAKAESLPQAIRG